MILFRCPKCGERSADLEGHKCVPAPDRLAKARAVLDEASERVGAEVGKAAFKEAAIHGQAFVKDCRVLKREEVLAPPPAVKGFDRGKYQREYMRGWRARRKGGQ